MGDDVRSAPPRGPLLGCIADDFSGATDLASHLVRGGMRTVQTIGVPDDPVEDADAIVVALKSRTTEPADAVARSLEALRWLQSQHVRQVYFKFCSTFDSTPRGNIGPVTDALLDALHGPGAGFTIACPALPAYGRTVYRGHLFVGDCLLSESGMEQHPLTPMTDPNLVRVLQAQTRRKVGVIVHDVVRRGAEAIAARFESLSAEGFGIAVVDAIDDDDLRRIGAASSRLMLVTAASGVAIGLPANWRAAALLKAAAVDRLPPRSGRQAIVSGSCSAATNAQVAAFSAGGGATYAVDPLAIAAGVDVAGAALDFARSRLASGPVLVHATAAPEAVKAVQAQLGATRAGALVEQTLARIAEGLVDAGVRQLVVAGGETSGAVVQALDVRRLSIGPNIVPGVPWTAAASPACGGVTLHLALKSGNFGGPGFFAEAFAKLARLR
jgi:uncharacterized protein YgbK (DUF1537 family)